ncbi:MAG: hypothetical protein V3T72_02735 [Thermoanaerobaculia bacterium]
MSIVVLSWKVVRRRRTRGTRRQAPKAEEAGQVASDRVASDRVAFDLINHLAAIRGYCELARMKNPDDPALAQRMDAAMETCTEAADLTRQLQALSRKHFS